MNKDEIKIHLTENYPNPIVKVNSKQIRPDDYHNPQLYNLSHLDKNQVYTVQITCEGYQEYLLKDTLFDESKTIEVTLQPLKEGLTLESIGGVIAGIILSVCLLIGTCTFIDFKIQQSRHAKPFVETNKQMIEEFMDPDILINEYRSSRSENKWWKKVINFFSFW